MSGLHSRRKDYVLWPFVMSTLRPFARPATGSEEQSPTPTGPRAIAQPAHVQRVLKCRRSGPRQRRAVPVWFANIESVTEQAGVTVLPEPGVPE